MKTEFKLEAFQYSQEDSGKHIYKVDDCDGKIDIIGQTPNHKPYVCIQIKGSNFFIKDRDLERFAVNILTAIKSKRLK